METEKEDEEQKEIKFMRRIAGYSSLDHRRNEDVLVKVEPVKKKLAQRK
jgi:hypothetical protein